jgi:outer membrane protein assembly factor BamB
VTSAAATICWGVAAIVVLALPQVATPPPPPGQTVPVTPQTPPEKTTPKPAYVVAWTHDVDDDRVSLWPGTRVVVTTAAKAPLVARSAETGEPVWTRTFDDPGVVAFGNDLVYVAGPRRVAALDEATGEQRWTAETSATPATLTWFAGGLIVGTEQDLVALRVVDGQPVWQAALPAPAVAVAADDRHVVVSTLDRALVAFDRRTGRQLRRQALVAAPVWLSLAGDRAYTVTSNGTVCAFGAASLAEDWCYAFQSPIAGPPSITAAHVIVTLMSNLVYVLDAGTGNQRRRVSLDDRPAGPPGLVGDRLLVPLFDGAIADVDVTAGRASVHLRDATAGPGTGERRLLQTAVVSSATNRVYRVVSTLIGDAALSAVTPAVKAEGGERRY